MGKELVMNNSIKYLIIIINTVIRMIVIKIIALVGIDTESSQMKYTTDAVFVCIFFNTGFLLMLCNANLSEQSSLLSMFNGSDSDFNQNWFNSIGDTVVQAMVFNIWFPIAMEIGYFGMRTAFRLKDSIGSEEGTKCKTIQQYANIYSGP